MQQNENRLNAMRQDLPGVCYKNLLRLSGHDFQREQSFWNCLLLKDLSGLPESAPQLYDLFGSLSRMTRAQAFRTLGLFPIPIVHEAENRAPRKKTLSIKEIASYGDFYLGTSYFLLREELELPILSHLKKSRYGKYENYAKLSKKRLDLIGALLDLRQIENIKPSFLWLLCEASLCLERQVNANEDNEISRAGLFELGKQEVDYYDSLVTGISWPGEISTQSLHPDSLQDQIWNQHHIIRYEAAKAAAENPDFDTEFYKPYQSAKRRWNRTRKNKKELQFANPKKKGRALGSGRKGKM